MIQSCKLQNGTEVLPAWYRLKVVNKLQQACRFSENNQQNVLLTTYCKSSSEPTSYPGSLPTPGAAAKTLVGAGHVNPQILGVN